MRGYSTKMYLGPTYSYICQTFEYMQDIQEMYTNLDIFVRNCEVDLTEEQVGDKLRCILAQF